MPSPVTSFFQQAREAQQTSPDGEAFNSNSSFSVGGDGVINPGQDVQIAGLNNFISAANDTNSQLQGVSATADQVGLSQAVAQSRQTANESFATAEGSLERRQRGLGAQLSDRQQRSQKRRISLARAISRDEASNATRSGFTERATEAARSARGIEQDLRGAETAGLIGLSNAAGQERIRAEQRAAEKKANRAGILGTVIGIGATLLTAGLAGPAAAAVVGGTSAASK